MKRSFVPIKEAEDLLQSLYGGKQGLGVAHVISEINLELSAFGFEVRKIKGFDESPDAYYAPIYVPDEENQGEGSQQQLKEVQGFSITDREKSLDAFKRDGWLSEHPKEEGLLCLGPRAILELGPWILNAHGSEMAAESKLTLSRAIGR
eukprot:jgi/Picre1/32944/NNA_008271.t1